MLLRIRIHHHTAIVNDLFHLQASGISGGSLYGGHPEMRIACPPARKIGPWIRGYDMKCERCGADIQNDHDMVYMIYHKGKIDNAFVNFILHKLSETKPKSTDLIQMVCRKCRKKYYTYNILISSLVALVINFNLLLRITFSMLVGTLWADLILIFFFYKDHLLYKYGIRLRDRERKENGSSGVDNPYE